MAAETSHRLAEGIVAMGAKRQKREAFLRAHPVCCHCGTAPATTEDHVPARICFKDKAWPEGYVFPACEACNLKDRDAEFVVAFHLHSMTDNVADFQRAYVGLRNNYPAALPSPIISVGEKAKALSRRGITVPAWQIPFAPIVKLSADAHQYFHRFAGKLAKAFYYKAASTPMPAHFRTITQWLVADSNEAVAMLDAIVSILPNVDVGQRVNVSLGNQFVCRHLLFAQGFVQTSGFNDQVFFTSISAGPDSGVDFDGFLKLASWKEAS